MTVAQIVDEFYQITLFRPVDLSIITWMSPLVVLWGFLVNINFHFYRTLQKFLKQIVQTLIRCHILFHLNWVCNICIIKTGTWYQCQ